MKNESKFWVLSKFPPRSILLVPPIFSFELVNIDLSAFSSHYIQQSFPYRPPTTHSLPHGTLSPLPRFHLYLFSFQIVIHSQLLPSYVLLIFPPLFFVRFNFVCATAQSLSFLTPLEVATILS